MLMVAIGSVREAHFIMLAVQRPEVRRLHLAVAGPTRFDWRFVHCDHAAHPDRGELRLVDRRQQRDGRLRELGQPGSADADPGVCEPLVLPIQRQVVAELVHQQPRQEAHVGPAALEHPGWRRRAHDGRGARCGINVFALDHRAHIVDHDVAAGSLRQAIAVLGTDELVLIRSETLNLGRQQLDNLNRNTASVKERDALCVPNIGRQITTRRAAHVRGTTFPSGAGPAAPAATSPSTICRGSCKSFRRSLFCPNSCRSNQARRCLSSAIVSACERTSAARSDALTASGFAVVGAAFGMTKS